MKKLRFLAVLVAFAVLLTGCSRIRAILGAVLATDAPATVWPNETAEQIWTEAPATDAPATEAPATEEPMAAPLGATMITVEYNESTVTVAGVNDDGLQMWSHGFEVGEETELPPWCAAALADGAVYVQANYYMWALDATNGQIIWMSSISGGFCQPVVAGGRVYTCSYYGSPLIALSQADGSTVFEAAPPDGTFCWAYSVELADGGLRVHFEQAGEEGGRGSALYDLDGKLISKSVD